MAAQPCRQLAAAKNHTYSGRDSSIEEVSSSAKQQRTEALPRVPLAVIAPKEKRTLSTPDFCVLCLRNQKPVARGGGCWSFSLFFNFPFPQAPLWLFRCLALVDINQQAELGTDGSNVLFLPLLDNLPALAYLHCHRILPIHRHYLCGAPVAMIRE